MKRIALAVAGLTLTAVAAFAADVQSGLKPGSNVGAFDVVDVSGPNKGKQLCYRCSYGNSPVVAAFIKAEPAKAATLVTGLQKLTQQHEARKLRTFVVFMGGPELKPAIEKVATEKGITIPMTFLPQGTSASDIAAYKINPEAETTILLWNGGKVSANFVNVTREKWSEVSAAAEKMLQ